MNKLSIRDLDMRGKRVFVRVDFNVPLDGDRVTDDTRIRETLPTLRLAMERGARLVLASHLGRPKGTRDPKYSLLPAALRLGQLLGRPVAFAEDCIGEEAVGKSRALSNGDVLVLENVRYYAEEEKNDAAFSKKLSETCDGLFVCDAFGSSHRAHASVVGITKYVQKSAAGLLMEKEIAYIGKAVTSPERPLLAILGGAKVSDKIEVIQNMMRLADAVLIGGAMAYTFLKAEGIPVGKSLVEEDKLELARALRAEAQLKKFPLLLPVDHVVAPELKADAPTRTMSVSETPADQMGLDIGPKTVATYRHKIAEAKTIVWNGPMGVFEMAPFAVGTLEIARAVAEATSGGAVSIVGGGDSVAAVHGAGVASKISHISTGGGASLEFLAGETLPGVAALTDK